MALHEALCAYTTTCVAARDVSHAKLLREHWCQKATLISDKQKTYCSDAWRTLPRAETAARDARMRFTGPGARVRVCYALTPRTLG